MPSIIQLGRNRHLLARDRATERLKRDRDTAAWNAEMKRLDAEEAEVKASADRWAHPCDVVANLADLSRLHESAKPETRQHIAQVLCAKVQVLGPTDV